jgi:3-hydroxybutyrate dehydrogenase
MSLQGRHALVTGGGRGIGRAVAQALTQAGARVTVTGRTESALVDAVAAGDAEGYCAVDATEETAVLHAFRRAAAGRGPIDILVANAGAAETAPFAKTDSAMFRRMLDLNLMGVVHAAHAALPDMLARGRGRIIAVASIAGLKGYPYVTAYVAAKHAVVGLARALAPDGETDMVAGGLAAIAAKTGRGPEEALAAMLKDNPQRRLIKPAEVAAACVWLASDEAGAVNGAVVPITGGEI